MFIGSKAGNCTDSGFTTVRLYLAGSITVHALTGALLFVLQPTSSPEQVRAVRATPAALHLKLQQTQVRDMQRRVQRLDQVRRLMAGAADPSAKAPAPQASGPATSLDDLAAQAEVLSAAIDAAERQVRARELSRLTGVTVAEAERKLEAESIATKAPPGRPETNVEKISRLDQRAHQVLQRTRAQLENQRSAVRVSSAASTPKSSATPLSSSQLPSASPAKHVPWANGASDAPAVAAAPESSARWRLLARGDGGGTDLGQHDRAGGLKTGSGAAAHRETPDARADAPASTGGRPQGRRVSVDVNGRASDRAAHRDDLHRAGSGVSGAEATTRRSGMPALQAGESHDLVRYVRPNLDHSVTGPRARGRTFGSGGSFARRVYLDNWYVLGPFQGHGKRTMQTVYPPEEGIDLEGAYRGQKDHVLTWAYSSRGFYPFLFPEAAEDAVYFAYTEIRVDEDQEVWLALAADDDAMLWLDGRLIWSSTPADKPWYHVPFYVPDERSGSMALAEVHRRVRLQRGTHRLLAKVYNRANHAFLSVVVIP